MHCIFDKDVDMCTLCEPSINLFGGHHRVGWWQAQSMPAACSTLHPKGYLGSSRLHCEIHGACMSRPGDCRGRHECAGFLFFLFFVVFFTKSNRSISTPPAGTSFPSLYGYGTARMQQNMLILIFFWASLCLQGFKRANGRLTPPDLGKLQVRVCACKLPPLDP